jgi:hypothetical protein
MVTLATSARRTSRNGQPDLSELSIETGQDHDSDERDRTKLVRFVPIVLIKSVIWVLVLAGFGRLAFSQGLLTAIAALFGGFGRLEVDISVRQAQFSPDPAAARRVWRAF